MRKHWIILLVAVLALAMEIACGDDDTSGLDGGADGDGDADADADSDTDADTDSDSDGDSDSDTDSDTDTDTDSDADADLDSDGDVDADSDADGDVDVDADVDSDADADCDDILDQDCDGHAAEAAGGDDCDDSDPSTYPDSPADRWTAELVDSGERLGSSLSIGIDDLGAAHISYIYFDEWPLGSGELRYATNAGGAWSVETIDVEAEGDGGTSLALDASGFVHIAYSDSDGFLRHASNLSGEWTTETPTEQGFAEVHCSFPSLAVTGTTTLHVSCVAGGSLMYATNAEIEFGEWAVELVDSNDGWFGVDLSSISIADTGDAHVAYHRFTADNRGELRYATNADGEWRIEVVQSPPQGDSTGWSPALALDDESGRIYISYYEEWGDPGLHVATKSGGEWNLEWVEELPAGLIGYTDIVLDHSGTAHVAYRGGGWDAECRYATDAIGTWEPQLVDYGGVDVSIAVGQDDEAHIAHRDYHLDDGSYDIRYAYPAPLDGIDQDCDGVDGVDQPECYDSRDCDDGIFCNGDESCIDGSCVGGTAPNCDDGLACTEDRCDADRDECVGEGPDTDGDGFPCESDCDDEDAAVNPVAPDNEGLGWMRQTVAANGDSDGDDSGEVPLAIGPGGEVSIAYHDWTDNDLRYATNASGNWVSETIDAVGDTGHYASLAIDASGAAHISYCDRDWGANVRYVTDATGEWVSDTVDTGGAYCRSTSLALDASGAVHITWSDGDLRYVANATGDWVGEVVDAFGSTGEYSSLALDAEGAAHISYYHTWTELRYATNATGEWVVVEVDESAGSGEYTSLKVDTDGGVHISYKDVGHLAYATNGGGDWVSETVDGTSSIQDTSLALDMNGSPRICYVSYVGALGDFDELLCSSKASGQWVVEIVVSAWGERPWNASLALDMTGAARIAYYDWELESLRYARQVRPDGIDQNCDGVDGVDADEDGHASEPTGGDDCDDADGDVYSGAADPVDGVDQDCDGVDG